MRDPDLLRAQRRSGCFRSCWRSPQWSYCGAGGWCADSVQLTIPRSMPAHMSDLIAQQGGDEERWAALCQWEMRRAIEHLGETAPLLAEMANYHLGWTDDFAADVRFRGQRIRPLVAMACAAAVGGDEGAVRSASLAAAVELLHNFTLVHDDIQDQSELRRHRPTVWARWGTAQAINAGDALYAAAHLALLGAAEAGTKAEDV